MKLLANEIPLCGVFGVDIGNPVPTDREILDHLPFSFARGIVGTLGSSLGRPTAALVARAVAVPVRTAARGGNAHRAAVQAGQGHGRAPL